MYGAVFAALCNATRKAISPHYMLYYLRYNVPKNELGPNNVFVYNFRMICSAAHNVSSLC